MQTKTRVNELKAYFITPIDIEYSYTATEWLVYEYAKFLKDNGIDASILVTKTKKLKKVANYKKIMERYRNIPKKTVKSSDKTMFRGARLITYKALPKDGIIYFPYSLHTYLMNILTKPNGQKYVIGSHIMQIKNGKMIGGNHEIYEKLLDILVKSVIAAKKGNVYFHVVNSEQTKYLVKMGVDRKNIFYVPVMADIKYLSMAHNKTKTLRIVHIGGLVKESSIIAEIIKELVRLDRLNEFEFYFVGSPQPDELVALGNRYKNIHILGKVDEKRKLKALQNADVLIVPAYETFSKAILEGFSSGLYVITSTKNDAAFDFRNAGAKLDIVKTGSAMEYVPLLLKLSSIKKGGKEINPHKKSNRDVVVERFDAPVVLPDILKMFKTIDDE